MTPPALSLTPAPSSSADILVLAARSGADGVTVVSAAAPDGLGASLAAVGFGGGKDELVRLPGTDGGPALAVVGLPEPADEDALRYAAGTAIRQLAGVGHVALDLPTDDDAQLGAVLEGAALGAYAFTEYRSVSRAGVKTPVETIEVVGASETGDALVARAVAVSAAAALVKDLVNTPPIDLYPASFTSRVEEAVEGLPVTVEVWDERRLEAEGFGGILGVGQGSVRPPRLVKVDYAPAAAEKHLALVGKGITFDSGGLSLKPPSGMVGMKYDMTGAATVLAAAKASGELLWPMPLASELRATINSDVADIANANPGVTAGGMLLAGVFLQEFIGRTGDEDDAPRIPWAHLDIAGPAKGPSAPYGFTGKGPSAVSVRALIRLAEDFSQR